MRDFIEHWTLAGMRSACRACGGLPAAGEAGGRRAGEGWRDAAAPAGGSAAAPLDGRRNRAGESLPFEGEARRFWSFDDHLLAVSGFTKRWWPADEVRTEAQWIAAKTIYARRIRHAMALHSPSDSQIELEARRRQDQLFRGIASHWRTSRGWSCHWCCSIPVPLLL